MVKIRCTHCKKNKADATYYYTDTRATREDYPHLTQNPHIFVHLCDDCDNLLTETDRAALAFEILSDRLYQVAFDLLANRQTFPLKPHI